MATISEALAIAVGHHQAGRLQAAEQIYRQILAIDSSHADAWNFLGVATTQLGRHEVALGFIGRAIAINAGSAGFHSNLGNVYETLGKLDEAVACFQRALELDPHFAEAHTNLGNALHAMGKHDEAVACYQRALSHEPSIAEAHNNLGTVLRAQRRFHEAAACYQRAFALNPSYAAAYHGLGNVLQAQAKWHEAVECHRRALELRPEFTEAHNNLGCALQELGKPEEAVACFRRALELKPGHTKAHYNLGILFHEQGKPLEAVGCYRRALELDPEYLVALGGLIYELQHLCQWEDLDILSQRVIDGVKLDRSDPTAPSSAPFLFLALPIATTAEQQLRCAQEWAKSQLELPNELGFGFNHTRSSHRTRKLAIGYLSADFHSHATAMLIVELFERHDRDRFTILGYSYGPDDGSPMRRRLVTAFDRFVDLKDASFLDSAQRIAADEVNILVDLKGYTMNARTQILALRPAAIQVNYLGYPGTMGASFMDYILVDDFVVPSDKQLFFTEKLVHLPGCYQVNDSQREIAQRTPSRAECGLPEEGFVFCCFDNCYKITPEVFGVWMKLLAAVPGSVLWLLEGNRFVPANLRREAEARGIVAERLVFAPRMDPAEHLSRHRLADLFLDTFPVNAHTTASDALWAGCPLLTMAGETFVSRVAGSLLRALGLPELVATSLNEYEALALRLARDRQQLAELRARLSTNRAASALFNGGEFAKTLEKAYLTMWDIYASGEKPRSFHLTTA